MSQKPEKLPIACRNKKFHFRESIYFNINTNKIYYKSQTFQLPISNFHSLEMPYFCFITIVNVVKQCILSADKYKSINKLDELKPIIVKENVLKVTTKLKSGRIVMKYTGRQV